MIRHFERQVDRLLGQEQRQTFLVQALEGLIRRIDHGRREPETRLVEQQECGIAHQGAPNREHLSFTTRHVANELPPPFGESRKHGINALEHLRRARLSLSGVAPSSRLFSTVCDTKRRHPSGESASPLRTIE